MTEKNHSSPVTRHPLWGVALGLLAWMVAFQGWLMVIRLLCHQLGLPFPPPAKHPMSAYLMLVSVIPCAVAIVSVLTALTSVKVSNKALVGGTILFALLDYLFNRHPTIWLFGPGTVAMMGFAAFAGMLLASRLRKPSYLVLAAVVGSLMDIYLVSVGTTPETAKSPGARYMLVPWGAVLGVGLGDLLFTALYLAGVRRFGFPVGLTVWALFIAFTVGLAIAVWFELPMPGLPYLSAGLILAHWRRWRLDFREKKTIAAMVVGMAIAFVVVALWRHSGR